MDVATYVFEPAKITSGAIMRDGCATIQVPTSGVKPITDATTGTSNNHAVITSIAANVPVWFWFPEPFSHQSRSCPASATGILDLM